LAQSRPESHLKSLPRLANSALTTNLLPSFIQKERILPILTCGGLGVLLNI